MKVYEMSKQELINFVIDHCTYCHRSYESFVEGEYYKVYQSENGVISVVDNDGNYYYFDPDDPTYDKIFSCAIFDLILTLTQEPLKQEQDCLVRLYVIVDGEDTIPVVTDSVSNIRWDVGNQDNGGMSWEDFSRVCEKGEVKQIKNICDLPNHLINCYPYSGGSLDFWNLTCGELCSLMDEEGTIIKDEI